MKRTFKTIAFFAVLFAEIAYSGWFAIRNYRTQRRNKQSYLAHLQKQKENA